MGAPQRRLVRDRRMPEELFVTIKGAQKSLSLGRTKIYELIASGDLQTVKIGQARRICVNSLWAYAARLTQCDGNRKTPAVQP
jgi:excisionase family DNA binding protein